MGLNSIKSLFLLFCLFNMILNQDQETLLPNGEITLHGDGGKTFTVGLDSQASYNEYIRMIFSLTNSESKNPSVIVCYDIDCQNRLYTSVQLYDKIYIFLKYKQIIKNQFYICVQDRENSNVQGYKIEISNLDKAYLPFNQQTSYYISYDLFNSDMEFIFQKNDSATPSTGISFWAQGKSISSAVMDGFNTEKYESSFTTYVFYGSIPTSEDIIGLKVKSTIGDYVTVGSVTMSGQTVSQELKDNRNEILVASTQDEVCFLIFYIN